MEILDSGILTTLIPFSGIYILILWLSLIIWTIRDSMLRSKNFSFQLLAGLLVTFLNILGLILYLIIRPPLRLNEKEWLNMEQKSLEIQGMIQCQKCRAWSNFIYCPECGNRLQFACSKCKKMLLGSWKHCISCGQKRKNS